MPTKKTIKKSTGAGKGRSGKGDGSVRVTLPKSMIDVLQFMGTRMYVKFGVRSSKLNPKYAEPICLALSDGDAESSQALQKRMLRAHRDFAGVGLKTVP